MGIENAEFDRYAQESYSAGMEDDFKRLMGPSARIFLEQKGTWLIDRLRKFNLSGSRSSLLDVGCGTGSFLQVLQELGFEGRMSGGDVSPGMLKLSEQLTYPAGRPSFHPLLQGKLLPFADASFDIITVLCVYHHIAPPERAYFTSELFRTLKPGGRVFIFEHNPWNPATRFIVSRCPIDVNAKLATAGAIKGLLRHAGFVQFTSEYFLFFPPRWKRLWSTEKLFYWIPFGGQYVTHGQKK